MTDYRPMHSPPAVRPRDPFYVVREKIQLAYATLSSDFQRWQDLVDANSEDCAGVEKQMRVGLTAIRVDLADLQQTNTIVEGNRGRFKDIDDEELSSRCKFCSDVISSLARMEEQINTPRQPKKVVKSRELLLERKTAPQAMPKPRILQDRETQLQQERDEQDKIAIDMAEAVDRLKVVALEANKTLTDQNKKLGEMDGELGSAGDNMNVVLTKVNKLLGKSDKGKLCCIVFLVFMCFLLLILIVYT